MRAPAPTGTVPPVDGRRRELLREVGPPLLLALLTTATLVRLRGGAPDPGEVLAAHDDLTVVGEAGNGAEAVELARRLRRTWW